MSSFFAPQAIHDILSCRLLEASIQDVACLSMVYECDLHMFLHVSMLTGHGMISGSSTMAVMWAANQAVLIEMLEYYPDSSDLHDST